MPLPKPSLLDHVGSMVSCAKLAIAASRSPASGLTRERTWTRQRAGIASLQAAAVQHRWKNKHEALFHAAGEGDKEKILQLLAAKANIHCRPSDWQSDTDGFFSNRDFTDQLTPLHNAASHGCSESVDILLRHGAEIESRSESGRTPLHCASDGGGWVQPSRDEMLRDMFGTSHENHGKVVRMLLDCGAKVDVRDCSGDTPIHNAATYGNWKVLQLLVSHGADVNAKSPAPWIRFLSLPSGMMEKYGTTPMHLAAAGGHCDAVSMLLDFGADAGARNIANRTPWEEAEKRQHIKVMEVLRARGWNPDS
jgi:ankyrin repeat protein